MKTSAVRKAGLGALLGVALLTSCSVEKLAKPDKPHFYPIPYTSQVDSSVTKNLRAVTTYTRLDGFQKPKKTVEDLNRIYGLNPKPWEQFHRMKINDTEYTLQVNYEDTYENSFRIKVEAPNKNLDNKSFKKVYFVDLGPDGVLDYVRTHDFHSIPVCQENYEDILQIVASYIDCKAKKEDFSLDSLKNSPKYHADMYLNSDSSLVDKNDK